MSADLKAEHPLVAVVLADPYGEQTSWGPLVHQEAEDDDGDDDGPVASSSSAQRPWCLTPLLGVPLLGWTLESLAGGGVRQVFVFVRDGVDPVRRFVSTSTYATADLFPLSVTVCPTSAFTPGDVLREVDSRALLKSSSSSASSDAASHEGTFVLARCGYVGTLDLDSACSSFAAKLRRETNLPCLSSIVHPRPPSSSPSQTIHACTPEGRLVYYHTSPRFPRLRRAVVPTDAFLAAGDKGFDVLLRTDLDSTGIDICSVEVPQLFTENFDYQLVRPDFVNGILTSDLLGKTIYVQVVGQDEGELGKGRWATCVGDVKSFALASQEILARKGHPMAPDENMPGDRIYAQRRNRVYIGDGVDLARDCTVGPGVLLGPGATIGPRSSISHSTLGASVSVGPDVVILRSVLFDNVAVSSGARIVDSVIDRGVTVLENATIEEGSLVGGGAKIGRGAKVKSVQVGLGRPDGRKAVEADLGEGGAGDIWGFEREVADSDDEDEDEAKDVRNLKLSRLGVSIDDPDFASSSSSLSSLSSVASLESRSSISVAGVAGIGQVGSTGDFLAEAVHSLDRAFVEGVTVDNALLELKTLRMASNVPQSRLRATVVSYLCTKAGEGEKSSAEAVKVVKRWAGLIAGLVGEDELAMVDTLVALQRHCADDPKQAKLFPAFLQAFYNEDVVSEEGVVGWFKSPLSRQTGAEAGLKLRDVGARFVQALTEAESDSGSGSG